MPSHLDALQTTGSVNLRRVAGGFHSVAKRVSFRVALRTNFEGFWSDFRTFWEAKMDAKTNFLEVFFRCFFRMRFYMDFELFFGGSKLEKSLKTIDFSMVFAKFRKIDVFEKVTKKL